jgi:hypothetical protein
LLLDQQVGGLKDGSVVAGIAAQIESSALIPFIDDVTGTLSGISVGIGATVIATVDHTQAIIFDLPAEPIMSPPAGVNCLPLMNRSSSLNNAEYGGKFALEIVNTTSGIIDGSSINWRRKGIKL